MSSPAMRCSNCGRTAKNVSKSGDGPDDCPDCGEPLEDNQPRTLLRK